MRKEFKNAKAKHGLNSKKWERRQIGIRPNMTLLLRPKYLLVYKTRREKLKRIGEGEKRRREEKETKKRRREGNEEEEKRRRKKEEEFKEDSKV